MAIKVSIVIPTYNRPNKLIETIYALEKQTFSKNNFEIIIVDDGSNRDFIGKRFDIKKAANIKYIRQKKSGPASARNLGVKNASGDIICFCDDDCIPGKDWLTKTLQAHYEFPNIPVIGGKTYVAQRNFKAIVSQFFTNNAMWSISKCGKKRLIFFPTSNVTIKKSVFERDLFNPNMKYSGGEDLEFFWRLYQHGIKFLYLENITVQHNRDTSFKNFIKQPLIYGKGNMWVQKIYPQHPALLELKSILKQIISLLLIPLFALHITGLITKKTRLSKKERFWVLFYAILYRVMYFIGYFYEKNISILKKL